MGTMIDDQAGLEDSFRCGRHITFLLLFRLSEVSVEIVQSLLPLLTEGLDPFGDLLQRKRSEPARTSLRVASAFNEPGLLDPLDILQNRRLAELKRFQQLRDTRFAGNEACQDRASSGITER